MEDSENRKIFAKNLQYYMNIHNKSRTDISMDLDIPYTTITSWIKGEYYPRIDKIEALANYFQIRKSDLMEAKTKETKKPKASPVVVNVYSKIRAGIPNELIGEVVDTEEISADMVKGGQQYFGVNVDGNSMEPDYKDKDVIIVRIQPDCESGDDCVVMVNGDDGTFKRVIKNKNGIILQPLNPAYEPLIFTNEQIQELPVRILGVVVEQRRKIK